MEVIRTVILPAKLLAGYGHILNNALLTYRNLVMTALEIISKNNAKSLNKAHSLCYECLKRRFHGWHNKMYLYAIREALALWKSYLKLLKEYKKGKIPFKPSPPEISDNFNHISLYTCQFKIIKINEAYALLRVALIPKKFVYFLLKMHKFARKILSKGKIKESKLVYKPKANSWEFHISVEMKTNYSKIPENDVVIDVNEDSVDCLIINYKSKKMLFLSVKTNISKTRLKFREIRRRISKKLKSTKTYEAKKLLNKYGKRESDIVDDRMKKIASFITDLAKSMNARIVAEKLDGINQRVLKGIPRFMKKLRYLLSSFHKRIVDLVEDKSLEKGVIVKRVNPRNSSITCPICGHKDKNNRRKSLFLCKRCGFKFNSHFVACMNLLIKSRPNDPKWVRGKHLILALRGGVVVTPNEAPYEVLIDDILRGHSSVVRAIITKIAQ